MIHNGQNFLSHVLRRHSFTCKWKRVSLNPKAEATLRQSNLLSHCGWACPSVHLLLQFCSSSFSPGSVPQEANFEDIITGHPCPLASAGFSQWEAPREKKAGQHQGCIFPWFLSTSPYLAAPLLKGIASVGRFSPKGLSLMPLSLFP